MLVAATYEKALESMIDPHMLGDAPPAIAVTNGGMLAEAFTPHSPSMVDCNPVRRENVVVEDEVQRQSNRGRGRGWSSKLGRGRGTPAKRQKGRDDGSDGEAEAAPKKQTRKSANLLECKSELSRTLFRLAQDERRERRIYLARASRRLGRCKRALVGRPSGPGKVEWEGGDDSQRIQDLVMRVANLKQSIETLAERLKSAKKTLASNADEKARQDIEEEIWEQSELRTSKIAVLQREESELREREQRLKMERFEYLRKLRAVEAEDQVNFSGFQPVKQRYQILQLLKRKRNADVFRAYDLSLLQSCVLRLHKFASGPGREALLEMVGKECEALKQMNPHISIAALLDHCPVENQDTYATVWEFCRGETLEVYMERNKPLQEKDARGIVFQILFMVRTSDARGHQLFSKDVKPSRFIVSGGGVRLSNTSITVLDQNPARSLERTLSNPNDADTQESDYFPMDREAAIVWSIGQILHEMLFDRQPRREALGIVQLPDAPKISTECRNYLQKILDRDRRSTIHDAWFDPFIYRGKQR